MTVTEITRVIKLLMFQAKRECLQVQSMEGKILRFY